MLLTLKADERQGDDRRRARRSARVVMDESDDVVLRPENPVAEVNLNLVGPRPVGEEAQVVQGQGRGHRSRPGLKTFRFTSLQAKDVTIKQGDIAVTLESTDDRGAGLEGQRRASPTPAAGRPSRATARACSTTASGSRRPTAPGSSTTAASTTPAPTTASSASNTSSSTPPASSPITGSSTRRPARW